MRSTGIPGWGAGLILAPAVVSIALTWHYCVDFPYMDQWAHAPYFEALARGDFDVLSLFAQHNDSRTPVSRAIVLGMGLWTGWSAHAEILLTQLIVLATLWNLVKLLALQDGLGRGYRVGILSAMSLALFSPVQHVAFGMATLAYYIPAWCLTSSLLLVGSATRNLLKVFGAAGLCTIATFTHINGTLCWLLVAPLLVVRTPRETHWRRLLLWAALFVATMIVYFWDYQMLTTEQALSELSMKSLMECAFAYFVLLGWPVSVGTSHETLALVLGFAVVAIFVWRSITMVRAGRHAGTLPWVAIGLYGLVSVALIVVGRAGWGLDHVMQSRYVAFGTPVLLAVLGLVARVRRSPGDARGFWLSGLGVAGVCALLIATFAVSMSRYPADQRLRGQAKAVTLLIRHEAALDHARISYPDPQRLRAFALAMDELGLLSTKIARSDLRDHMLAASPRDEVAGRVEFAERQPDGALVLSGWAFWTERERPVDAVVVTDGQGRLVAMDLPTGKRAELARQLETRRARRAGWKIRVDPNRERSLGKLRFWALDSNSGALHAIAYEAQSE